jgi:uncharacterized protein
MEYKRFNNTIVARLDRGEEILTEIEKIAKAENIKLAKVSAIGAVNDFTVGVYDVDKKEYKANSFTGDFELLSLLGNINTMNGKYYCHLHMSAGNEKGEVFGGHLNRAVISVTCEMFIDIIDGTVDRKHDDNIGINLFKF